MSYLRSFGPAADPITRLAWGLGAISVIVSLIVAGLLLAALFRPRRALEGDEPGRLEVRRDAGGMAWIYVGVGISTVVLFASTVWTLLVLAAVAAPPTAPALTVQVVGHQWWWEVRYDNPDLTRSFTAANEIHIPVGRPVRLELTTRDVIHSFWIPQLAGKTDLIPGQTNNAWLQADAEGVYRGQCAEYCGMEHARMAIGVIAVSEDEFRSWLEAEARPAAQPSTDETRQGMQAFRAHCSVCHTVRGTDAGGAVGPDLTHVMSRRTLAAGALPNDPGHLARWVTDPQGVKPGCSMPNLPLAATELGGVLAYVQTLH